MHGGDSLLARMTSTANVYNDSGVDVELDHKARRVTEKLSETINTIANEPSVAFYRIQEHVRKTLPQLVEQKHEVEEVQQLVQGACFDTEYAGNAVKAMQKSVVHFQNIQELLKNAMFMKQQIDYEEARKRQGRVGGGNGRQEGQGGNRTDEGSDNMDDSAVSTDSSLAASGHANTEEKCDASAAETGEESAERRGTEQATDVTQSAQEKLDSEDTLEEKAERDDTPQEKDTAAIGDKEEETDGRKEERRVEEKDTTEKEEMEEKDTTEKGQMEEKDTTEKGQMEEKDTTEKEETHTAKQNLEESVSGVNSAGS